MSQVAEVKKFVSKPMCMEAQIGRAEHKRNDWVIDVPETLTPEDLLVPGYWAHVSGDMSPLDKIEARWEDGSKIAHYRVIFAERTYAKVKLLHVEDLEAPEEGSAPADSLLHEIAWKGPMKRFAVIRKTDRAIVSDGHRDRAAAVAWMMQHERT